MTRSALTRMSPRSLRAFAVLLLVAAGVLAPSTTAFADATYSPVSDFVSNQGDYGVHLERNDSTGVLRATAFNNTTVPRSVGLGVDDAVQGSVTPLWNRGTDFATAFSTTLDAATTYATELPSGIGMTYGFYADLPAVAGDPAAVLLGTYREPGRWLPVRFDADASATVTDVHFGYDLSLSSSTANAGVTITIDAPSAGLTAGEVWAAPASAQRSPFDSGSPSILQWQGYGAGLRTIDLGSATRIATAQFGAGRLHQQVAIPASLAPGDYDLVVGDPASGWWPIGTTSISTDHNLTVTAPGDTPVGDSVVVQPVDSTTSSAPVTITFASVTAGGTTTLSTSSTPPSSEQTGFSFLSSTSPVYYYLEVHATFTGSATVCFPGTTGDHVYHYDGTQWVDITDASQQAPGMVCATTTSFSPFAVARPFTFLAPVANSVLNLVQGGSAVPLKFTGTDKGLNIIAAGYPSSRAVSCPNSVTDPVETLASPTASNALSYDPKTSTYTYVWKTDKAWRGTCRTLALRLVDGSTQRATFQFK